MPLSRTDIRDALVKWLSDATGLPVLWVNQEGSRPSASTPIPGTLGDHCTLLFGTMLTPGAVAEKRPVYDEASDSLTVTHVIPKRASISVNAYCRTVEGEASALAVLEKAVNQLMVEDVTDLLADVGLGFFDATQVIDLSALLEAEYESRAHFEAFFHCTDDVETDQQFIETVEATIVAQSPGVPDMSQTFEADFNDAP